MKFNLSMWYVALLIRYPTFRCRKQRRRQLARLMTQNIALFEVFTFVWRRSRGLISFKRIHRQQHHVIVLYFSGYHVSVPICDDLRNPWRRIWLEFGEFVIKIDPEQLESRSVCDTLALRSHNDTARSFRTGNATLSHFWRSNLGVLAWWKFLCAAAKC